jgi:hypothetical protein
LNFGTDREKSMTETFSASATTYENWMREQLGSEFVEADLEEKHRKMRKNPFTFLRATYWRWAEVILDICPQFANAPKVLAIGDTHLENFGTWRDAEGRLIWGANDFDEAAVMPYPLDIVRLAASALLAGAGTEDAADICDAILAGYKDGLGKPEPIVLERDYKWLRTEVILSEPERADFWLKFDEPDQPVALRFAEALKAAVPAGTTDCRMFARSAGTGSLGRPRAVVNGQWRGGPVLREVKALLPSSWSMLNDPGNAVIRVQDIATGPHRAPDPHYSAANGMVLRRLSPNSRKIEVKEAADLLLSRRMLKAMGKEIANCHGLSADRVVAVKKDLEQRNGSWLKSGAEAAAQWIEGEQQALL